MTHKPFPAWDSGYAQTQLGDLPPAASLNRTYYDGDHWQGGLAWVGPAPQVTNTAYQEVMTEIARVFAPVNAIAEITQRHAAAVLGHEPAWALTTARPLAAGEQPTPDEQQRIDEAEAALTAWWDARGVHGLLHTACITLLLAERAALRLFVPSGVRQADGRIAVSSLPAALDLIRLEAPLPSACRIVRDPTTYADAGVYVFDDDDRVRRVELVYLDDQKRTVIRVLAGDAYQEGDPLDLGTRLTIYEMTGEPFITEPIRRQQNHLNMHHTMMGRNGVLGGFVSRIFLNAQLPDVLNLGGGTTNSIVGTPIRNALGEITGYATPNYIREEPVTPATFIDAQRAVKFAILEQAHQLHALLAADGDLSGESRKQARADFELSIQPTATQAERAIRWVLETSLAFAAALAGQVDRYQDVRAVVTMRTDTGPISADDQTAARENYTAGVLSLETAQSRVGVDDTDAESSKIATEKAARAPQPNAPVATSAQEGDTIPMVTA